MLNRIAFASLSLIFIISISLAQSSQTQNAAPDITGQWTGVWSAYNPSKGSGSEKELCKKLTCTITNKDGVWEATFEGDCGRPYKYQIKMEGRQIGKVVLFKGTTDLGAQDGGIYDWIGRANDKEFVGFFTNAFVTGTFNLTREKK
ncbi:MAG: hypothetical protein AB1757_26655 [Acidobacteriota bacterium]